VAAAAEAGHPVRVFPGPSAPATALAISGLSAVPHLFLGFLPARAGERRRALEGLRERTETLVWFEAPHRLRDSLADAARLLGPRRACVARELTKIHEEAARGTLEELAALYGERGEVRGEVTVVVEGREPAAMEVPAETLDRRIAAELDAGRDKRDLARRLGKETGRPSREIYARAVEISRRRSRPPGREGPRRQT
jgi:16S rRNA (cytidine1402-2'-O)-methyltransferase